MINEHKLYRRYRPIDNQEIKIRQRFSEEHVTDHQINLHKL